MAPATQAFAAAVAFLAPAALQAADLEVIDGCYYRDHKYDGHRLQDEAVQAENHKACQGLCQVDVDCHFFTFFAASGECYKLGKNAIYDDKSAEGASCGPKFCPDIPSGCTELPADGFPGETPDETEKLFPSHRQPTSLECWPRSEEDGLYDSCPTKTVLEDSQYGWPAACMGLVAKSGPQKKDSDPGLPDGETCESACQTRCLLPVPRPQWLRSLSPR